MKVYIQCVAHFQGVTPLQSAQQPKTPATTPPQPISAEDVQGGTRPLDPRKSTVAGRRSLLLERLGALQQAQDFPTPPLHGARASTSGLQIGGETSDVTHSFASILGSAGAAALASTSASAPAVHMSSAVFKPVPTVYLWEEGPAGLLQSSVATLFRDATPSPPPSCVPLKASQDINSADETLAPLPTSTSQPLQGAVRSIPAFLICTSLPWCFSLIMLVAIKVLVLSHQIRPS